MLEALSDPAALESLFDHCAGAVFFVKDAECRYLSVNQTLVDRCGVRHKQALWGKRADEVFPDPYGAGYRRQDEAIISSAKPVYDELELHFYPSMQPGWCLTHKVPLQDRSGKVVGLVGLSTDLMPLKDLRRGEAAAKGSAGDLGVLAGVITKVRKGLSGPLRAADLAAASGVSVYQCDQRMRQVFGLTAMQYLQRERVSEAMRLLKETDHSAMQIASLCGYSDQSAFTRQFRRATGLSPVQYRRSVQGVG
ncbi:MAG: AraC family transcriptional regulator [Planctomycetota bacterium]|nr:AraC family transcriptional regulator [Planctomycetota bacterium]